MPTPHRWSCVSPPWLEKPTRFSTVIGSPATPGRTCAMFRHKAARVSSKSSIQAPMARRPASTDSSHHRCPDQPGLALSFTCRIFCPGTSRSIDNVSLPDSGIRKCSVGLDPSHQDAMGGYALADRVGNRRDDFGGTACVTGTVPGRPGRQRAGQRAVNTARQVEAPEGVDNAGKTKLHRVRDRIE